MPGSGAARVRKATSAHSVRVISLFPWFACCLCQRRVPVSSVLIEDWLAELIRNEQPRLARLQIDGVHNAPVRRKTEKIRLPRSLMLENDRFGLFRILADLNQVNGARGSTAANRGNRQHKYLRRATIRRARLKIVTGVVRVILSRSVLPIDLRFVAHYILIEICAGRCRLPGSRAAGTQKQTERRHRHNRETSRICTSSQPSHRNYLLI